MKSRARRTPVRATSPSETGSRWLIHHGASSVTNLLSIKRIQGSILTGLDLYGIDYRFDKQHTSIEHINLILRPLALLGGKLHLQRRPDSV